MRQIVEQLADGCVLGTCRRTLVEAPGLDFDRAGLSSHSIKAKWLNEPYRRALHESLDILAANEWNVLAKFGLVHLNQAAAVFGLFLAHTFEDGGRAGESVA